MASTNEARELAGKVALVTGGAKNIGRDISLELAAAGAAIAVNTRASTADAEKVVKEIRDAGGDADMYIADIADPSAVKTMVDRVLKRFGRIDFLVLNASVRTERPFLERAAVLQALFPGEFDLGLRLKAHYDFLDLALAAMNGNPIGNKVFPAVDPVQTKDVIGRVGVSFEIAPGVRFEAGTSAETGTGFHPGSPATV